MKHLTEDQKEDRRFAIALPIVCLLLYVIPHKAPETDEEIRDAEEAMQDAKAWIP